MTILAATLFVATTPGHAQTLTTNLVPVADTYIRDSAPTSNFGTANPILVGIAGTPVSPPQQRCLFRFSLDSLPAGAVISSANLRLIAVAGPREAYDFDLNRLLVNWTEDGATWNARLPGTPWTTAGAAGTDFVATPSATAVLSPVSVEPVTNNFSSPNMVADLQLWLDDPGTNFGWILHVAGGQPGSGRKLASREDTVFKPVLTVEYTVSGTPDPATPPTILGTSLESDAIRFSFNAESNRTYAVEFRDSLTTSNWSVLTNIPAQPADATVHITNSVSADERYFRVRTP